jgi:hypothetical protein
VGVIATCNVDAGEALAREAVDLALRTDRVDRQTDALVDLAEVLRVGGRSAEAVPIVADALRRYELIAGAETPIRHRS